MVECLLFGGGLDSIAYSILTPSISVFAHYDYGQVSVKQERESMNYWAARLHKKTLCLELQLPSVKQSLLGTKDPSKNAFVPGRNLNFVTHLLTNHPYISKVVLGFTDPGYTPFNDADSVFVEHLNVVCQKSFGSYVSAEYVHVPRLDVIKWAFEVDSQILDPNCTFTCWTPKDNKECGTCQHCLSKTEILKNKPRWSS